jgi:hypothetical protein
MFPRKVYIRRKNSRSMVTQVVSRTASAAMLSAMSADWALCMRSERALRVKYSIGVLMSSPNVPATRDDSWPMSLRVFLDTKSARSCLRSTSSRTAVWSLIRASSASEGAHCVRDEAGIRLTR